MPLLTIYYTHYTALINIYIDNKYIQDEQIKEKEKQIKEKDKQINDLKQDFQVSYSISNKLVNFTVSLIYYTG